MRLNYAIAGGLLLLPMLAGQDTLTVTVNGTELTEKAIVRNGVSYVPVKALATALRGTVGSNGKTLTIEVPPTTQNPQDLWSNDEAWTALVATEKLKELEAWRSKAATLLELVDFDALKYETVEMTSAVNRLHQARLSSVKSLERHLLLARAGYWTELDEMSRVLACMDAVAELLVSFREEALSSFPPKGLPSFELMKSLYKHGVVGLELKNPLHGHVNALIDWYNDYPSPPGKPLR